VDTLEASQHLIKLRDFGLLQQVPKGASTYHEPSEKNLDTSLPALIPKLESLVQKLSRLKQRVVDKAEIDEIILELCWVVQGNSNMQRCRAYR
jgi:hypothetical protein